MIERVLLVFLLGGVTAVATGLGAIPFIFVRGVSATVNSLSSAAAAGLMLGASFGLLQEGSVHGVPQTMAGAALGMLFILGSERFFPEEEEAMPFADLRGRSARQVFLVLAAMTLHSFAEGIAVGVSFGGGRALATLITIAIAVHNIPEGLAISAVLRARGASLLACAGWSIFSSLPQPLMAVPAFIFVDFFRVLLPYGLGFAAGAMVFLVLWELLPEAYEGASRAAVGLWVTLTLGLMVLFQSVIGGAG